MTNLNKKLILSAMMLSFSSISMAQVNESGEMFAEGNFGQSYIEIGGAKSEFQPPAAKRPMTIGLAIDEEVELMPEIISGDACEALDTCSLFDLPSS